MAGEWVKMRWSLRNEPEVIAIGAALDLDGFAVAGRLHAIWSWADEHSAEGDAPGVTVAWLDSYVCAPGFADALEKVGWLVRKKDGLCIPRFEVHMGEGGKRRALATKRNRKYRQEKTRRDRDAPGVMVSSSSSMSSSKGESEGETLLPAELDTPEAASSWRLWLADLDRRGYDYPPAAQREALGRFAVLGPARFCAAVRWCIEGQFGSTILYEPRAEDNGAPGERAAPRKLSAADLREREVSKRVRAARKVGFGVDWVEEHIDSRIAELTGADLKELDELIAKGPG
jgi:hypothetical protein